MNHYFNVTKKYYLCTRCGRRLVRKVGPAGFFWGCSYYPRCQKTFSDDQGIPVIRKTPDFTCPQCQTGTLVKHKKVKSAVWICKEPLCGAAFHDRKGKPNLYQRV
jgi:ssDNA-binding Zn-finger/Zn-ribbon topoisomerase 1